MLIIKPRKIGENVDRLVKRYKKKFDKTKRAKQVRARLHFTKGSDRRRKVILKAIHRERYKRLYL